MFGLVGDAVYLMLFQLVPMGLGASHGAVAALFGL